MWYNYYIKQRTFKIMSMFCPCLCVCLCWDWSKLWWNFSCFYPDVTTSVIFTLNLSTSSTLSIPPLSMSLNLFFRTSCLLFFSLLVVAECAALGIITVCVNTAVRGCALAVPTRTNMMDWTRLLLTITKLLYPKKETELLFHFPLFLLSLWCLTDFIHVGDCS